MKRRGTLFFAFVVLVSALSSGAFYWRRRTIADQVCNRQEDKRLSATLQGGNWPQLTRKNDATAVKKIIGATEVIDWELRGAFGDAQLYVAYWAPGNAYASHAQMHLPDDCWTANGWKCEEVKRNVEYEMRGQQLRKAEWRKFSNRGNQQVEAVYWCIVGGITYEFFDRSEPVQSWIRGVLSESVFLRRWWSALRPKSGYIKRLTGISGEVYFVRLNTTGKMEALLNDPDLSAFVSRLGVLVEEK